MKSGKNYGQLEKKTRARLEFVRKMRHRAVVVGMATCGIASGAAVLAALADAVQNEGLNKINA